MILIINTADGEEIYIALAVAGKIAVQKKFKAKYRQAEKLLPAIFDLLMRIRRMAPPADGTDGLIGIAIVTGPGSFSALRIGISVANTLGWALKIPVAGARLSEFKNSEELAAVAEQKVRKAKVGTAVAPHYGSEPKITLKKS